MNANEEYNKILQLVKSDCPNNRLLGFQLAKGLDYDLIELLSNTNHAYNSNIKSYLIGKYYFHISEISNSDTLFSLDTFHDDVSYKNVKIHKNIVSHRTDYTIYTPKWIKILNEFKEKYINLIINE